jgi:hypothetical protein
VGTGVQWVTLVSNSYDGYTLITDLAGQTALRSDIGGNVVWRPAANGVETAAGYGTGSNYAAPGALTTGWTGVLHFSFSRRGYTGWDQHHV